MTGWEREARSQLLTFMLSGAIIAGLLLAWNPAYWPVSVAHAGVLLTGIVWAATASRVYKSPQLPVVAAIALWGALQIVLGQTVSSWLTLRSALTWFCAGVCYFLATQVLRSERNREIFRAVMMWSATGLSILALLQLHSSPVRVFGIFPADSSVVGTFLYKNQFAAMLEMLAPIALYSAFVNRGRAWRGAMIFVVMFAAVVASASRTGLILITTELIVVVVISIRRGRLTLRTGASVTAIFALLLAIASLIVGPERIWEHFQEKNPYSMRQQLLTSTLHMVEEKPLLGYGMGTWSTVYPRFATFDSTLFANEAHNDWAQWASEGGIPFCALLFIFVAWHARAALRSIWGMGFVAVAIHSLVDYPTREPVLALLWFTLAGALSQADGRSSRDREMHRSKRYARKGVAA